MVTHAAAISIRNILLVQLMVIVLVPGHVALVRHELLKIWKRINEPLFFNKERGEKKNKFWEIDMTKFEP
jgi:hypothetical protein